MKQFALISNQSQLSIGDKEQLDVTNNVPLCASIQLLLCAEVHTIHVFVVFKYKSPSEIVLQVPTILDLRQTVNTNGVFTLSRRNGSCMILIIGYRCLTERKNKFAYLCLNF